MKTKKECKFSETEEGKKIISQLAIDNLQCNSGYNCESHKWEIKAIVNALEIGYAKGKVDKEEEIFKEHPFKNVSDLRAKKLIEQAKSEAKEELIAEWKESIKAGGSQRPEFCEVVGLITEDIKAKAKSEARKEVLEALNTLLVWQEGLKVWILMPDDLEVLKNERFDK